MYVLKKEIKSRFFSPRTIELSAKTQPHVDRNSCRSKFSFQAALEGSSSSLSEATWIHVESSPFFSPRRSRRSDGSLASLPPRPNPRSRLSFSTSVIINGHRNRKAPGVSTLQCYVFDLRRTKAPKLASVPFRGDTFPPTLYMWSCWPVTRVCVYTLCCDTQHQLHMRARRNRLCVAVCGAPHASRTVVCR